MYKIGDRFVNKCDPSWTGVILDICSDGIYNFKGYFEGNERGSNYVYDQFLYTHYRLINENADNKQYVVWKVGGGPPTCIHNSLEKATSEAERLCRAHGGQFVVAEVLKSCKKDFVKWSTDRVEDDNVPF